MSFLSGKSDLFNHISGMGGWYDSKTKQPVKFGDDNVCSYTSDLLQDFEEFKKQTNGVMYQHKKVKLQPWFKEEEFEFIKKHCKMFDYKKNVWQVEDKRHKCGWREETVYSFTYWDKSYSFEELKKKGVYIEMPIYFNTLLDLLPYLSYLVSVSSSNYVCISDRDYVDDEHDKCICEYVHENEMFKYYKKRKADLYLEVCKRYFLYDLNNRTKLIPIKNLVYAPKVNENGDFEKHIYLTSNDIIDYMHDIEFVWKDGNKHTHWSSPKFVNEHTIELSKEDVEYYLKDDLTKGNVMIKYVTKPKDGFPLYLE